MATARPSWPWGAASATPLPWRRTPVRACVTLPLLELSQTPGKARAVAWPCSRSSRTQHAQHGWPVVSIWTPRVMTLPLYSQEQALTVPPWG
jgi:hypothetical protein